MDKRKELKMAYKLNPRPMGVYQIKNLVNGKIFLGSAMNIPGKLNGDRFKLASKGHPNKSLQTDWELYGPDQFTFETLETLKAEEIPEDKWPEAVLALEDKWLDMLQPYGEKGYNTPKKG
ncbi:MAG: GIY-YIG nuclease family protein [Bacillota bacterium]